MWAKPPQRPPSLRRLHMLRHHHHLHLHQRAPPRLWRRLAQAAVLSLLSILTHSLPVRTSWQHTMQIYHMYIYIYHMLYVFAHTRLLVHTRTCTTGHGVSFFEIRRLSLKSFSRRGLWVGLTTDSRQKLFPNPIPGTRSLDSLAHLARLNRLMCLIARSLNRSIT